MRTIPILILTASAMWAQEPAPLPELAPSPESASSTVERLARAAVLAQVKAKSVPSKSATSFGYVTSGNISVNMKERFWRNTSTAQSLGLTTEQQQKMDDIFQQHRLRLIDLNAALEKEEVTLEPLVADDTLDDAKITAQIDRVAQARAELEKANGRMLLGIRKVLTPEQWRRLSPTPRPVLK